MPIEKLQAMVIKNQDEKLALIEQKEELNGEEDDLMGEDPEMIDQKMCVLAGTESYEADLSIALCFPLD